MSQKEITMKRTLIYILAALVAVVLYAGLVHMALVVADVSKPGATTVYGLTSRRLWALAVIVVALISLIIGWQTMRQAASRSSNPRKGKWKAIVVIVAGLITVINGGLNLATANGGPGTGNGVVGSAMALVLGLTASTLGGLALIHYARNTKGKNNNELLTDVH